MVHWMRIIREKIFLAAPETYCMTLSKQLNFSAQIFLYKKKKDSNACQLLHRHTKSMTKSISLIAENLHFVLEKLCLYKFLVWTLTFSPKDLRSSHKTFPSDIVRKPAQVPYAPSQFYSHYVRADFQRFWSVTDTEGEKNLLTQIQPIFHLIYLPECN